MRAIGDGERGVCELTRAGMCFTIYVSCGEDESAELKKGRELVFARCVLSSSCVMSLMVLVCYGCVCVCVWEGVSMGNLFLKVPS